METIELNVEGMTCGGCENAVRNVVSSLAGVEDVEADHETGKVVISASGPVDLEGVKTAVAEAGYTVADRGA